MTVSVCPDAVVVGVGAEVVGSGRTGVGLGEVAVVVRGVVVRGVLLAVGSGIAGAGATTVCWRELFEMTSAITSPTTTSTAAAATHQSHCGDFGPPGGGSAGS